VSVFVKIAIKPCTTSEAGITPASRNPDDDDIKHDIISSFTIPSSLMAPRSKVPRKSGGQVSLYLAVPLRIRDINYLGELMLAYHTAASCCHGNIM
jgi:hypothetical protein